MGSAPSPLPPVSLGTGKLHLQWEEVKQGQIWGKMNPCEDAAFQLFCGLPMETCTHAIWELGIFGTQAKAEADSPEVIICRVQSKNTTQTPFQE